MSMPYAADLDCSSNTYCVSDTKSCASFTPYLEPLTVVLGNNHYTIPPEGYTFNLQGDTCTIAVSYLSDTQGMYILGDTFMRNFVTTFDNHNKELRLAVNVNAPAGTSIEFKFSGGQIFGLIMGSLLVVGLIAGAIYMCIKKKREKENE